MRGKWTAAVVVLLVSAGLLWLSRQNPEEPPLEQVPVESARSDAHEPGIAWFSGTVDEAFTHAEDTGRPIFLYWGAVWCPPCNQLKATIFRRADFIAKTQLFVAVYIDGDAQGAQSYQDRFGAVGYPTLIVFNSAGSEITRIPGGIDPQAYLDVLDLALEHITPVADLLARIMEQGYQPDADEWRLLAYYSWDQDRGRALGTHARIEVFEKLAQLCATTKAESCSSFDAVYLQALTDTLPLDPALARKGFKHAAELLASPEAGSAAADFMAYHLGDVIAAISPAGSPERRMLLDLWQLRINRQEPPAAASTLERMHRLDEEVALAKLGRGTIDEALQLRVREAVQSELGATGDAYARSALLNEAIFLLDASQQGEYAMEMLQNELADVENPWYWMLDLAALAERHGRSRDALGWLRRAYAEAEGPATRVQWGQNYIDGLTRLEPQSIEEVASAVDSVFDDLQEQSLGLQGRNRRALERIGTALHNWAAGSVQRQAVLQSARERLGVLCDNNFLAEESARRDCSALLGAD